MQIFPFSQKELKLFRELNVNKIQYIIIGLAAAAMQGAPIVTKDVDIWFRDINDSRLQDIFKKCGAIYIPSIGLYPPSLAGKDFALLDIVVNVHGLKSFKHEYKNSIKIKIGEITLKVLPLKRIIKSKQFLHREKDISILPVLKDVSVIKKGKRK